MTLDKDITQLDNIFYHGTTSNNIGSLIDGVKLELCNLQTDFGHGFYLTSNIEQARKWAYRKEREFNIRELTKQKRHSGYTPQIVKGVVIYYYIDISTLIRYNNLQFEKYDTEWADFVYANRSFEITDLTHNKDAKYDLVYGPIADGNFIMELTIQRDEGSIGLEEYLEGIINPRYLEKKYDQLSIHTERALSCIKYEKVVLPYAYKRQKTRVRK